MFQNLLFDLDGTLTNSAEGITKCVQYALRDQGVEVSDLHELEVFIGPPLRDSFMKFYGFTREQAEAGVEKYRERYTDIGICENKVYDGMPELLQEDFTPEKLAKTAVELLQPERQAQLQSDLEYMKKRLGEPGAVDRVAQLILKLTEEKK